MGGKRQERKDLPWEGGTYVETGNTDCPIFYKLMK